MIVNVEWGTRIVTIPRTEMPIVQTVPSEIRELDLTELRYALHDQQDSSSGIVNLDIHEHIKEYTTAGILYAQAVNIINDYYIKFENGLYNVRVVGGNTNLSDVEIKTSVGVGTSNSAGLQTVDSGGTGDCPTIIEIADEVESRTLDTNVISVTGTPVTDIDDFKADVSNLSADVNIVEVAGSPISSIDDFKADLSGIPEDVWTYITRTMTSEMGMTPSQEAKLDVIINELANGIVDANVVSFETDDVVAEPVWNKVIP